MTCLQPLIQCNGRVCCMVAEGGEEQCHMTRCDSQFYWGCIRHEFAKAGHHNNDDEFVLGFVVLLVCS